MADITLPSGVVIRDVPEGTTKSELKRKAIAAGLATEQDFASSVMFESMPAPSMFQRAKQAITGGQKEDFPEYVIDVSPEEALKAEKSMGDPTASIGQDKFGNPVIQTSRGTFYLNKPGLSINDVTGAFRGAEQAIKTAAPYIAGGLATAPLKTAAQVGAQGAIGLAQEAITQAGRGFQGEQVDWSKLATTPLFAMAGDVAGRVAYRVAAPLVSKIFGKAANSIRVVNADGTLSDDAIRLLKSSGMSPDTFSVLASQEVDALQRTGVLTREQAERFNFMKGMGIEPTTAQITRTADDFQLQQELAKRTTGVRGALESQEAAIAGAFDTRIQGAGGISTGSPISDAVLNRATALDTQISELYNLARANAPADKSIRLGRYAETLRSRAPDNELTGGLIRSIRGDLMERGIIDKNFRVIGKVDVDTAETIRKVLNSRFQSTNDFGRQIIRELKNSLDDDVISTAGRDAFRQARQAKAAFESELRPERVSKFDINERSLVRDILDNTIKADDVFDQAVLSNRWKPSDLQQLTNYLAKVSDDGVAALNTLRGDTIDYIKQRAFTGPIDEAGNQAISRASLERAINKIGQDKLQVILNPDEVKFLDDMLKLARLREPVRGTALGRGPSAQAIDKLEKSLLSKIPVVGGLADLALGIRLARTESAAVQRMISPAAGTMSAVGKMTPAQTFVGPTAAGRIPAAIRGIGAGTVTQEQR